MYTRYYDTYPAPVKEEPIPAKEDVNLPELKEAKEQNMTATPDTTVSTASIFPFGGIGGFKGDDILLIALLFLVMSESRDDNIMPLILGYLLLGGGL